MIDFSNPALDCTAIRAQLLTSGFVQIDDYLPPARAEDLFACLDRGVNWDLAYSEGGAGRLIPARELATLTPAAIRQRVDPAFDQQGGSFRFIYNTFRAIDSWQRGEYPDHPLYRLADALHGPEHLAWIRELTGRATVQLLDLMAARYLPGHFLTPHDDSHGHEGREVAYVLNLTKEWRPEWGGLLHMMEGAAGPVTHTLVPRFNSMVLFYPPRWHFVSQVANFARKPRYTLTGWMLRS